MNAPEDTEGKGGLRGRRSKPWLVQRLAASRRVIGYTAEDEALVYSTRDIIKRSSEEIASALYDQLLTYPETAEYFETTDHLPDRAHLDARTMTLQGWLQTAVEAPLDEELGAYLMRVGRAHTARGPNSAGRVKGRYLVAGFGIIQAELVTVLNREIEDREIAIGAIKAWGKLLALHLDLFFAVYGAVEGNPHWY